MIRKNVSGATIGALMFAGLLWVCYTKIPVVMLMSGTVVERLEASAIVRVKGRKIRDCKLVPGTWVGFYQNKAGEFAEALGEVTHPGDKSKDSSRAAGWWERKDFGLFKVDGIPAYADSVKVTVQHLCDGDDIPRVTDNGAWYVGPYVE